MRTIYHHSFLFLLPVLCCYVKSTFPIKFYTTLFFLFIYINGFFISRRTGTASVLERQQWQAESCWKRTGRCHQTISTTKSRSYFFFFGGFSQSNLMDDSLLFFVRQIPDGRERLYGDRMPANDRLGIKLFILFSLNHSRILKYYLLVV